MEVRSWLQRHNVDTRRRDRESDFSLRYSFSVKSKEVEGFEI